MSNIIRLQKRGLSLDEMDAIISVAEGLRSARQIAYTYAKKQPHLNLMPRFGDLEGQYQNFCAENDIESAPVFDEAEHIRKRIAERDHDFIVLYPEENAAYLASIGETGDRSRR